MCLFCIEKKINPSGHLPSKNGQICKTSNKLFISLLNNEKPIKLKTKSSIKCAHKHTVLRVWTLLSSSSVCACACVHVFVCVVLDQRREM